MRKYWIIFFIGIFVLQPSMAVGQVNRESQKKKESLDEYKKRKTKDAKDFRDRKHEQVDNYRLKKWKEFQDYRSRRNQELIKYMSERWIDVPLEKPLPAPKLPDPIIPPIVPKDNQIKIKPVEIPHSVVIPPTFPKEAKPKIVVPPVPDEIKRPQLVRSIVDLLGTPCDVALNNVKKIVLNDISDKSITKAWGSLNKEEAYKQIITDCIKLKEDMNFNGWAMMNLCHNIAVQIQGRESNASAIIHAYLMNQMCYDVYVCKIDNKKLTPIYTSDVELCQISRFRLGGKIYNTWERVGDNSKVLIFEKLKSIEKAEPVTFGHIAQMNFSTKQYPLKSFTSMFNDRMSVIVGVNESLMNYYNSLPLINDWSFYARQPMYPSVKEMIIPPLRRAIEGKSEIDAANDIIHFVQSAFKYEVDSVLFGRERTYFKEELFYHRASDCEDRSVLFSDLIHQLLGLDVVLLHYPNHLATAVRFKTQFDGHYVIVNEQKYMICDPTCRYSDVGVCHKSYQSIKPKIHRIYN